MKNIFKALNIKPLVKVDKKRILWMYKDWEVAIDSVKNLGNFVEIEYKGNSGKSPKQITTEMVRFLKDVGCGKISRNYMGYPYQLLFPKEIKYEVY